MAIGGIIKTGILLEGTAYLLVHQRDAPVCSESKHVLQFGTVLASNANVPRQGVREKIATFAPRRNND
jgi:hypothetical protein